MFLRILGTNGSGKTTVVKGLIDLFKQRGAVSKAVMVKLPGEEKTKHFADKWEVPGIELPVLLLGKYDETVQCSGVDKLSQKGIHDYIEQFIINNAKQYHILSEGSIFSGTKRYAKAAVKLREQGVQSWFGVMATSRDECVRGVTKRRLARGKTDPLDTTNLDDLFQKVKRMAKDAIERGVKVEWIESTPETSLKIFEMFI